jgi:hypothetical protein
VTFVPPNAGILPTGLLTANLVVNSSTIASPVKLQLTGTGFDFTLTAVSTASGTNTATVVPGQTGFYNFTLTPLGAASGPIAYQCATLPAPANAPVCLLNPYLQASLPVGVQGQGLLAVATGGPTSKAGLRVNSGGVAGKVLLVCGVLLLPFSRMGRVRRRGGRWLTGLFLLVALAMGVASCAGSGGGNGGKVDQGGGTPAGTYTTQITATAGGVVHAATVTLVVN